MSPQHARAGTGGGSHTVRVYTNVVLVALQPEGGEIVRAKTSNDRKRPHKTKGPSWSVGLSQQDQELWMCALAALAQAQVQAAAAASAGASNRPHEAPAHTPPAPLTFILRSSIRIPTPSSGDVSLSQVLRHRALVTSDTRLAVDFIPSSPELKAKAGKAQQQDRGQPL